MRYYPVFLNLKGRRCVVVGGGRVSERKVAGLLNAGAHVVVISPRLTGALEGLKSEGLIEHIDRQYIKGDLKGAFIAIAATSDPAVNHTIAEDAGDIPLNVVDTPQHCSFIVPSVISRGELTVAVSTSGISPALSRTIREEIEGLYGGDLKHLLEFLSSIRGKLMDSPLPPERRSMILKRAGSAGVLKVLRESGIDAAVEFIRDMLTNEGVEA